MQDFLLFSFTYCLLNRVKVKTYFTYLSCHCRSLIYVLTQASGEAADASWKACAADTEWIKPQDASEADGKIPAEAPNRVLMREAQYSPAKQAAGHERFQMQERRLSILTRMARVQPGPKPRPAITK